MYARGAWSVARCPQYVSSKELSNKTSIERMLIKIRNALTKTYGSIQLALQKIEVMLPSEISSRDLSSILALFSLNFTSAETQAFVKFTSNSSKGSITFGELSKVLTEDLSSPRTKLDINFSQVSVKEVSHSKDAATNTETSLAYEDIRVLLHKHLIEKFDSFIEAFKWTTKSNTITYFQFIRLLNFLNIPNDETIIKELLMKLSCNGHITLERFKAIWYNDENLCIVTLCNNKNKLLSRYCGMHYSLVRRKGKELYKKIIKSLDVKLQAVIASKINKLFFPTYKAIKGILGEVITYKLHKKDWKAIEMYLNSKEKNSDASRKFTVTVIKKSPSSIGLKKLSTIGRYKSTNSVRYMRTIAYTNDTLFLSTVAN